MNTALHEMGNIATSISYFQSYSISPTNCILDIGTHFGSFLQRLYSLGYDKITGIDVDFEVIATGCKQYPRLRGRISDYDGGILPFCDSSFDVVTMFDILEHVEQPAIYLGEVQRVLKPNGLLIFQTPNLITNIPWEIFLYRSFTYWRRYHRSLQTLPSLRKLLMRVGFKDIKIEKHTLISDYNTERARRVLGYLGIVLLRLAAFPPLYLYPNFWGSCRKAGK